MYDHDKLRSVLPLVRERTANNNHLGALLSLARAMDHDVAAKVMQGCITIRNAELEVKDDLRSIYRRWYENLMRYVQHHYPTMEDEVRQCL